MLAPTLLLTLAATLTAAQCVSPITVWITPTTVTTVTAVPTSTTPPTAAGVALHPNGNTAKCLDIADAVIADGTSVRVYDCNGSRAQQWLVSRGDGTVRVAADPSFCLDAGSNLRSGDGVKIWTCYSSLQQQRWYYTDDDRLAVTGSGQCLDLPNGNVGGSVGSVQTQIWQCSTGNTHQAWTSGGAGAATRKRSRFGRSEM